MACTVMAVAVNHGSSKLDAMKAAGGQDKSNVIQSVLRCRCLIDQQVPCAIGYDTSHKVKQFHTILYYTSW